MKTFFFKNSWLLPTKYKLFVFCINLFHFMSIEPLRILHTGPLISIFSLLAQQKGKIRPVLYCEGTLTFLFLCEIFQSGPFKIPQLYQPSFSECNVSWKKSNIKFRISKYLRDQIKLWTYYLYALKRLGNKNVHKTLIFNVMS